MRSLTAEQGAKGRVKCGAQGGNLASLDLIPLRDERGSGGRLRDHVIGPADVVAVYDGFLEVNALVGRALHSNSRRSDRTQRGSATRTMTSWVLPPNDRTLRLPT